MITESCVMRRSVQAVSFAVAVALAGLGGGTPSVQAQAQPARPAAPATSAPGRAPALPGAGDVLATVSEGNVTEKITKGELINFLSRYPIPASENREQVYRDAVDSLVNTKLLTLFVNRQKIAVPPGKVEEEISRLETQLKTDGQDLSTALSDNNMRIEDIKKELEDRIRWSEYVKAKATDAELRRYFAANRDLFNNTQVRASHILLRVAPDAAAAEKEKVKQKLQQIKADLDANKVTFSEAANKYSEDPANAGGAGATWTTSHSAAASSPSSPTSPSS
ncbi:MAG: peptidylprolyl isomerase [Isosphaeraceae bacterium]